MYRIAISNIGTLGQCVDVGEQKKIYGRRMCVFCAAVSCTYVQGVQG